MDTISRLMNLYAKDFEYEYLRDVPCKYYQKVVNNQFKKIFFWDHSHKIIDRFIMPWDEFSIEGKVIVQDESGNYSVLKKKTIFLDVFTEDVIQSKIEEIILWMDE